MKSRDGVLALLGHEARPDVFPDGPERWETLPFVDLTDESLRRYRAWVRRMTATGTVVRP